ncbi:MAG: DUF357 domain-containing protein [Candidatus Pacearchaeota archaeon]
MSNTEKRLIQEAEKWFKKAKEKRKNIKVKNKKYEDFLENIDAYLADYKYFLVENKFIEAFEAVIWAWAWIEIGLQKGFLKEDD